MRVQTTQVETYRRGTSPAETYHRDLHSFVKDVAVGSVSLDWTHHALLKAWERGFSPVTLLELPKGSCVELTCSKVAVEKLLVRVRHSAKDDLCLVLAPVAGAPGRFTVITAWLNDRNDTHRTLDRSKYAKAA